MKEKEKKTRGDGVCTTGKRKIRSAASKNRKPPSKIHRAIPSEVHEISETSSSDSTEEARDGGGVESRKMVKARVEKNHRDSVIGGGVEETKTFRFPMNRIRRIMRSDNTAHQIMQDAVFLVNKATEMFMDRFTEEAYESSVQDKKKFIHYKHLSSVVSNEERYEFLADCVPEKLRADVALEQWKTAMADAA